MDWGSRFWIFLGSRRVRSRALSPSAPSAAALKHRQQQNFFGLHNVGFTAELGGFLELWPVDFIRARFEARGGVSGAHGFDANIELDVVERYGPWTFSAGPRFQFGDNQFMNAYFSVTPAEAFLNGNIFPYQAHGGVTSVGGLGAIKYNFTPTWSATAFGGVNRYVDSAARKPNSQPARLAG